MKTIQKPDQTEAGNMIYSSIHANDDWSKYPAAIRRALTYLTTL